MFSRLGGLTQHLWVKPLVLSPSIQSRHVVCSSLDWCKHKVTRVHHKVSINMYGFNFALEFTHEYGLFDSAQLKHVS